MIRGGAGDATTWKEALVQRLNDWSISIGAPDIDGEREVAIGADGAAYGIAWMFDTAVAALHYPGATFLSSRSPCPYLVDRCPIGVVGWVEFDAGLRGHWLTALGKVGAGRVVSLSTGAERETTRLHAWRLDEIVGKGGFCDGDALLNDVVTDPAAYLEDCAKVIAAALASHGLDPSGFGVAPSAHNPLRICPPLRVGEVVLDDEVAISRALRTWSVDLWSHAFDLADDPALFG